MAETLGDIAWVMANPAPRTDQLGPVFQPGHAGPRRGRAVERALTKARSLTPQAIDFCHRTMRDELMDVRWRLKAAEIILHHGMPRDGSAARRELIGEGIQSLRVEFVRADGSTVSFNDKAPPGFIEVPFEVAKCDSTAIEAVGNEDKT